jgi:hypothetical protein
MVGLDCYQGFGNNFQVNQECTTKDAVENGCYMFLRRPLADLGKDISNFNEWGYRFRFFYGLCRGVLSQSFMNNWINGSLYFFPIQVDTFYNKQNKISQVRFCEDVVYYNRDSNNFYYRSSPYNFTTNKFVGKIVNKIQDGGINDLNLLYPTTVINLGMKDYFYSEITFDPTTRGFILPNINPTSYADTSDLINLFVISRITDENFLEQLISLGDNSINQLFSRGNEYSIKNRRIDGDNHTRASRRIGPQLEGHARNRRNAWRETRDQHGALAPIDAWSSSHDFGTRWRDCYQGYPRHRVFASRR